jgi:hypothetical protein
MTDFLSRRQALTAGTALGAAALGASLPASAQTVSRGGVPQEKRTLDQLYQAARAEGGKLVVYAGGDIAAQQASVVTDFKKQFPDVDLTMVVDYSKFHDVRIDNQLATGTLVADVVHLQTLQNFPRWKKAGHLRSPSSPLRTSSSPAAPTPPPSPSTTSRKSLEWAPAVLRSRPPTPP